MAHMDWNDSVSNDGGDFKLLEPGIYPFTIKHVEKSYVENASSRYSGAKKAIVTLRVNGETDVTDGIILDTDLEWKICQFMVGAGIRKHGETKEMNWDNSFLVGKTGYVEIEHREYQKDGETRKANQVARYIDPADLDARKAAMASVATAPAAPASQPAQEAGGVW